MRIARTTAALVLGGALGAGIAGLAACADARPVSNGGADCEKDEQGESFELRDPDCGYYDEDGNWVWFAWVDLGRDSEPPDSKKSSSKTQTRPAVKLTTGSTTHTTTAPSTGGTGSAGGKGRSKSK